jgi:hypothetical protein
MTTGLQGSVKNRKYHYEVFKLHQKERSIEGQ